MEDESSYFRRRAAEQLAAAERADSAVAARIHQSLAARMLAKAGQPAVHDSATQMPPPTRSAAGFGRRPLDG